MATPRSQQNGLLSRPKVSRSIFTGEKVKYRSVFSTV